MKHISYPSTELETAWDRWIAWLVTTPALLFIFTLYAIPRIAILLIPVAPASDAAWYFNRASEMAMGLGYMEAGVPTAFWPPGWPLVLSIVFRLFGASLIAAKLFNLACAFLTGWLTLDLGRRLFGSEAVGRMGLLLLALYPNNIGYIPLVGTEVFYTMLLLLGCRMLIFQHSMLGLLSAGLVFGLATLVKAQTLVVVPLIFIISALRSGLYIRPIISSISKAGVVCLVAAIVVFPWSYRNHQIFGEWILISTNGGYTLLTGNNPSARGDYTPGDPLVTTIHRTITTQVTADREARKRAMEWIEDNPSSFVALIPLKVFRLWGPDGEAEWLFQSGSEIYDLYTPLFRLIRYLNQAYYFCLMLGFAFTGYLFLSRKASVSRHRFDWWLLPYGIALYPTLIAMIFSGQSRFHYPVMPFVAMSCGWLLVSSFEKRRYTANEMGID